MAEKKSQAEQLKEKLFYVKKHATLVMSEQEEKKADKYCEGYKKFLDAGKTEREAAATAVAMAEKAGFKPFDKKAQYKAGDKIYVLNREKAVILAVIGKSDISNGVNLTAAHIDSPRLDLKQNPLYESDELGYFKTHYYGGIKKYQWPTVPMSLHGVIVRADGSKVTVRIGEDEGDPVFVVTDLLPHLAEEQYKRPATKLIKGEELNILIGSRPFRDDKISEKVKLNLLNILFEKYGIVEKDFLSAELECVPAFKAKDVGFDRSLVGAYGQDDRVCAYTAFTAIIDMKAVPEKTAVCVLTDKEETGSDGNTGSKVYRTLDEIKASGKINIGVFSDKNPFGYVDENGEYQGYDIYFANRLGKDLGVEINYVSTEAANRVEYLETGKVDIILANFTVTEERAEKVDFALPYMNVALGVVSPDSNVITSLDNWKAEDRMIVISGTTAELYLTKNYPDIKLQKYDSYATAKSAIENGNGVAWANDNTEVIAFAKQNKGYTVGIDSLGSQDTIAPAVSKGNETLLNWINDEIKTLGKENFFHADYDATLTDTYGADYKETLVVEGGEVKKS